MYFNLFILTSQCFNVIDIITIATYINENVTQNVIASCLVCVERIIYSATMVNAIVKRMAAITK
ncbi:MAG: hypothetical protein IKQ47_02960 [Prevotella sp.]|nr:hypothetical protein [Prevotella sp.]MBR4268731.1 hypothetical protein [Prevotella sp.]